MGPLPQLPPYEWLCNNFSAGISWLYINTHIPLINDMPTIFSHCAMRMCIADHHPSTHPSTQSEACHPQLPRWSSIQIFFMHCAINVLLGVPLDILVIDEHMLLLSYFIFLITHTWDILAPFVARSYGSSPSPQGVPKGSLANAHRSIWNIWMLGSR